MNHNESNTEPAIGTGRADVLQRCRHVLPGWRDVTVDDVEFDEPKGFSSFTMGIRVAGAGPGAAPVQGAGRAPGIDPPAVLYRHLHGKENAILDPTTERRVFLLLGEHGIAARSLHYDDVCRIEEFYVGRTLTADDVYDPSVQRGVARRLHRLHGLQPEGLPRGTFFELLFEKWGPLVERVLIGERRSFPEHERPLCEPLLRMLDPATLDLVLACLPGNRDEPVFCHNDTYHGNTFLLNATTGDEPAPDKGADRASTAVTADRVRLLDFEFSCFNHRVFDFANFFAETAMRHGLAEEPHFAIGPARHGDADLARLIGFYLDREMEHSGRFEDPAERRDEMTRLVSWTRRAIAASDFMYAMAAVPLAVEPIQKIRFLPYAAQRFARFRSSLAGEVG